MSGRYFAVIVCDQCLRQFDSRHRYLTNARSAAGRVGWQRRWSGDRRRRLDVCPACLATEGPAAPSVPTGDQEGQR